MASLSQQLLDQGYQFCSLFTDAANPTSNKIYQKIGYYEVAKFQSIILFPSDWAYGGLVSNLL